MVPVVARHQPVREVMRERQRELGEEGDAVIEGRDIGTVVAPDAEVKVYLVADREIRARRRQSPSGPGSAPTRSRPTCALRDESDAARMRPAEDATRSTPPTSTVDDVVERIEELVRARTAGVNRVDVVWADRPA